MLAGMGTEILGWNGGSDQSDGDNDLGSEPCLGDKSGPFRLVLSGNSERNFFPTTGKKGSICESPEVGCDRMSGAVRLCGPWFSSVCGEFFPGKGGSCESRHLQEEWSAWGWPRLPLSWFPGKEQVTAQP